MAAKPRAEPLFVLRGHESSVTSVHFISSTEAETKRLLAAGDSGGVVKVWSLRTRRPVCSWQAHAASLAPPAAASKSSATPGGVLAVRSIGDGRLLSQGKGGEVHVWDLGGSLLAPLRTLHTGALTFCRLSFLDLPAPPSVTPSLAPPAGADFTDLPVQPQPVPALSPEPPRPSLLSQALAARAAASGQSSPEGPAAAQHPPPVAFAAEPGPDGPLVLAASREDHVLKLWDLRTPKPVQLMRLPRKEELADSKAPRGHGMPMSCSLAAHAVEGLLGVVGLEDSTLACHSFRAARLLWTHQAGEGVGPVMSLQLQADGSHALAGGAGREVLVWRLGAVSADMETLHTLRLPHEGVGDAALRCDGRLCAVAGWDKRLRLFSLTSYKPLALLQLHQESVYAVDFAAPDRWNPHVGLLASGSKDSRIGIWELFKKDVPAD
eukprot:g21836.t1